MTTRNLTSILSLTGIPFLAGFYSKDIILEKIITMEINMFIAATFIIACVLTSIYSIVLFKFIYKKNRSKRTNETIKDKRIMSSSKTIIIISIIVGPTTANMIIIQTPKVSKSYKTVGPLIIILGLTALILKEKKNSSKRINSITFTNKLSYSPLSGLIYQDKRRAKKNSLNIIDIPKIIITMNLIKTSKIF